MTKRTGPTNPILKNLIEELRSKAREQECKIWKRVADDLEKSTRSRRIVNLSKLERTTGKDETVVVPGKVLGGGDLKHKLTISAYEFSKSAKEKINESGSKIVPLTELVKESPEGKKIRIIG